jgi:hypothetical protein
MLLDDRQLAQLCYPSTMYFFKRWVSGVMSHPRKQLFQNSDEAGSSMFTGAIKVSQ